MIMQRAQQGMTLFEVMGALAVAALVVLGLSAMIDTSLDDVKGQQAGLHQEQLVNAAHKYIGANYAALAASTAGGTVAAVTTEQLKTGGFLADSVAVTNAFRQATCVLVRQPAAGKLEALVATYGGVPIPERDIALTAMQAGQGAGYISTALPGTARGASWQMDTTGYRNVACGATPALTGSAANDGGHLVSNLSYDGPGQLSANLLYRNAVPGRPQLNQMATTIHLAPGSGAQAVADDAADPRCTAASGTGKLAIDAFGRVLSCQGGVWKLQGAGSWQDPVAAYADLPAGANHGDVRMVAGLNRAFTWTGAQWAALAVDQDGNFLVPATQGAGQVKLNQAVVKNAACSDNGMVAREASGLALSCQSGRWRSPLEFRLTTLVYAQEWTSHVDDGTEFDTYIDLTALPGPRPLYITGYAFCHATGFPRAYAYVNMLDDAGPRFIAGGCMSRPDNTSAGMTNRGTIGLQVIPENVNKLHLHREVQVGAGPEDYINIAIKIYNSE